MPETVVCRVVGLQSGLQTADVRLHRQSDPIRRGPLRQLLTLTGHSRDRFFDGGQRPRSPLTML